MNILLCTFSFPSLKMNTFDGRFILSEAMAYAKNGAYVRVITPHFLGADKKERIHENISVFRFRYFLPAAWQVLKKPGIPLYSQKTFLSLLQIPLLCLSLMVTILKHGCWADIIHAQWTPTALLALPAKWILGKKIVLTVRGSDIRLLPRRVNRFIHRNMDAVIDCFGPIPWNLDNKKNFAANYIRLPLLISKDSTGNMPEDMKAYIDTKQDAFIIVYIGRFDSLKITQNKLPLITLIHASNILKLKEMNFHVFYIGDGDSSIINEMSNLTKKYKLADDVTILGPRNNVFDYIEHCHIGIGGIAFNGVSQDFTICKKPQILVLGPDNEGTPWIHGVNAIFIKADDEKYLAEKITWAIDNSDLIAKIGKKANEDMKAYMMDANDGGLLYLREFNKLMKKEFVT